MPQRLLPPSLNELWSRNSVSNWGTHEITEMHRQWTVGESLRRPARKVTGRKFHRPTVSVILTGKMTSPDDAGGARSNDNPLCRSGLRTIRKSQARTRTMSRCAMSKATRSARNGLEAVRNCSGVGRCSVRCYGPRRADSCLSCAPPCRCPR
jgi:hypothetical protein